ncbi:Vitelline membrane outer layer protein 1, partial [Halocaridina rubra]
MNHVLEVAEIWGDSKMLELVIVVFISNMGRAGTALQFSATYGPEDYVHVLGATQWGFWGETHVCPNGSYAYGIDLRLEEEQGLFDDDTSVNALMLHCQTPNGTHTGEVTSSQMDRGHWTGVLTCAPGTFFRGYNIK